ncbi:MAG: hypothetical protein EOP49_45195, partial [Sphingobacteriales bacterium]
MTKQAKAGNYILNDSTMLLELAETMKDRYSDGYSWTTLGGYKAIKMEGQSTGNLRLKCLTWVRGNKNNVLLLVTEEKNLVNPRLTNMFSSLELIPYAQAVWKKETDDTTGFTAMAPSPFRYTVNEMFGFSKDRQYFSFDSLSGTSYFVTTDTLSKYFWAANDSFIVKRTHEAFLEDNDELISEKMIAGRHQNGNEMFIRKQGSNTYLRARSFVSGNVLYTLSSGGELPEVSSKASNQFFESFEAPNKSSFDLKKHKGNQLLSDLVHADSATRAGAYQDLTKVDFSAKDLPALHTALIKRYLPVYEGGDSLAVNDRLGNLIVALGDSSSIRFISDSYFKSEGVSELLKYSFLEILANTGNEYSYQTLARLLTSAPPRSGYSNMLGYR